MTSILEFEQELRAQFIALYKQRAPKLREEWRNSNRSRREFDAISLPSKLLS